jgi:hypothetical protein
MDGKCLIHLLLKNFSTAFISACFKSFMAKKGCHWQPQSLT